MIDWFVTSSPPDAQRLRGRADGRHGEHRAQYHRNWSNLHNIHNIYWDLMLDYSKGTDFFWNVFHDLSSTDAYCKSCSLFLVSLKQNRDIVIDSCAVFEIHITNSNLFLSLLNHIFPPTWYLAIFLPHPPPARGGQKKNIYPCLFVN